MSKSIRTVLTAVAATVSLACLAGPAMADTPWQAHHARREQVNNRLGNQNARIHHEVKEGEMSHAKAMTMRSSIKFARTSSLL